MKYGNVLIEIFVFHSSILILYTKVTKKFFYDVVYKLFNLHESSIRKPSWTYYSAFKSLIQTQPHKEKTFHETVSISSYNMVSLWYSTGKLNRRPVPLPILMITWCYHVTSCYSLDNFVKIFCRSVKKHPISDNVFLRLFEKPCFYFFFFCWRVWAGLFEN